MKPNENIKIKGYKWVGKERAENKEGGGVGILIKNDIIKACTINQIDTKIEIMSLNIKTKYNEDLNIFIYYGKQESRTTKEEAINEFTQLEAIMKKFTSKKSQILLIGDFNAKIGDSQNGIKGGDKSITRNGKLLIDLVNNCKLIIVNKTDLCKGKWTRINTKNENERSIIDYLIVSEKRPKTHQTNFKPL